MKTTKLILSLILAITASLFIGAVLNSHLVALIVFAGAMLLPLAMNHEKGIAFTCGALAAAFAANCDTKPVTGLEVDIYLMNRADIDLTASAITGRTISLIVMKAGKIAYKFEGLKSSNTSSITFDPASLYFPRWIHKWGGFIFDNTATTKTDIIEALASANIVAVVRNKWKGTDSNMECEALGWAAGLEMSLGEKKSDDATSSGSWKVEMSTAKDGIEDNAGYIVHDTDQSTTLAMLDALTVGSGS